MYAYGILLYGFLTRKFIEVRRYPLNFLGAFAGYIMIFFVLFYGGMTISPDGFKRNLEAIVVGYFLLVTVFSSFLSLSGMINTEAKYGTLEKLYVSPFRFPVTMCASVLSQVCYSLVMGILNLAVMLLVAPVTLEVDLLTVVPLMVSIIMQGVGLSLALGGIALLFKRIRSLFPIVQYAVLGIISLSLTERMWPRLLPVGQGTAMLSESMTSGTSLLSFPPLDHGILVVTSVVYLTLGYLSFHLAQHRARRLGVLDEY